MPWMRVGQVTVAQVVVGMNLQRRWGDCRRLSAGGVGGLSRQAEHHGGRLLRGLEVGSHERVLGRHWGLDGRRDSDDGGLRCDAVVEGRLGQGVGVGEQARLGHRGNLGRPCWT